MFDKSLLGGQRRWATWYWTKPDGPPTRVVLHVMALKVGLFILTQRAVGIVLSEVAHVLIIPTLTVAPVGSAALLGVVG